MPSSKAYPRRFAYFISPHGFGHASRAAAVISALHSINPSVHFEIFTTIPEWFFKQSLITSYTYHYEKTDIGVIQKNAFFEDLEATLLDLNTIYPLRSTEVNRLANIVAQTDCEAVLCDIAPMGIEIARCAGVPSILIENFTWDWIYEGYLGEKEEFSRVIPYLKQLFEQADFHIQTEPLCFLNDNAVLHAQPASRKPRISAAETRSALGISDHQKTVLITMGGIPEKHYFLPTLKKHKEIHFILPGNYSSSLTEQNVTVLSHQSKFFHPDLVNACDAVVAKLGYSTIAEVFHAGIPMLYLSRPRFRESPYLASFVESKMPCAHIQTEDFENGSWLPSLIALLTLPKLHRTSPNGADQIAAYILDKIN